ncbi:MAG: class II fructose-bisphosphatase [Rhodospirillales bacterium]|nr:class II fructose-bisphosphatase [Rhodospirillales bacterium]MBO6786586.1 class II fructose-bisphosphatase [Rhodospirillales bacterium]
MSEPAAKDRNLSLELVRVTEAAALAAYRHMGSGDHMEADQAAISAARSLLESLAIDGTVRVGEGREGEVDKLYLDEKVGTGRGPEVDVAVVALEGASIVARGGPNAISTVAMAEGGGFLKVPDIYMNKIAVGPGLPEGVIDLDREPEENLKALAAAKSVPVSDLVVCMLDRPRHSPLLEKVRAAGARVRLILGGDVSAAIATALDDGGVDIYMGIGAAPQGVLSAAALRGFGGQMQGRLFARKDDDRVLAKEVGIEDFDKIYNERDMASGNVTFAATGITYGAILAGIRSGPSGAISHSLVVRSLTGTYRFIEAHHDFTRRPPVG